MECYENKRKHSSQKKCGVAMSYHTYKLSLCMLVFFVWMFNQENISSKDNQIFGLIISLMTSLSIIRPSFSLISQLRCLCNA